MIGSKTGSRVGSMARSNSDSGLQWWPQTTGLKTDSSQTESKAITGVVVLVGLLSTAGIGGSGELNWLPTCSFIDLVKLEVPGEIEPRSLAHWKSHSEGIVELWTDYSVESVAEAGQKSTVNFAQLLNSVLAITGVVASSLVRPHCHSSWELSLHSEPSSALHWSRRSRSMGLRLAEVRIGRQVFDLGQSTVAAKMSDQRPCWNFVPMKSSSEIRLIRLSNFKECLTYLILLTILGLSNTLVLLQWLYMALHYSLVVCLGLWWGIG